jgi:hypothetical protein
MPRNTIFLIDALGENWQNEITEDMHIEPCAPIVRGLTAARYQQLWGLFPSEPGTDVLAALAAGMDIGEAASALGMSPRQIKNTIASFLKRVSGAVAQKTFLPAPVATTSYIQRRPRSRRGRPPNRKALPAPPQTQVDLPF